MPTKTTKTNKPVDPILAQRDWLLRNPALWFQSDAPNELPISAYFVLRYALLMRWRPALQAELLRANHELASAKAEQSLPSPGTPRRLANRLVRTEQAQMMPYLDDSELLLRFARAVAQRFEAGDNERTAWLQVLHQPAWLPATTRLTPALLQQLCEPLQQYQLWLPPLAELQQSQQQATTQQTTTEPLISGAIAFYQAARSQRAPHHLLKLLREFVHGNGSLKPLVQELEQQPQIAAVICRQAERNNLATALLQLGPARAAELIAGHAVRAQLDSYPGPYQTALSQYRELWLACLQGLQQYLQQKGTKLDLGMPSQLFGLLWCAGWFRSRSLSLLPQLQIQQHPVSWHCAHWFGGGLDEQPEHYRQLTLELAKRWQLPSAAISAVNIEDYHTPTTAVLVIASVAVWQAEHWPNALPQGFHEPVEKCLKTLNINKNIIKNLSLRAAQTVQLSCYPRACPASPTTPN